jgi:hypothetical protein
LVVVVIYTVKAFNIGGAEKAHKEGTMLSVLAAGGNAAEAVDVRIL